MIRTVAFILGLAEAVCLAGGPATAADLEFFEKKVRPILIERCYSCHSEQEGKSKGGLLLDSREGWVKGGDSGTAVIPGAPGKSLLIQAINYDNPDLQMPPKGRLPQDQIDALARWVERGAPDPRVAVTQPGLEKSVDVESGRTHWAYEPIRNAPPPAVRDGTWPLNDIDRFVLAGLEARGLRPVPDASRLTLVRRVYFDLIGLPPTPEQISEFLSDASPDAYERLVEKLLASPHLGERWGRHWLDVARFGESLTLRGFVLPGTWRYRDYVIQAFNDDRPFDRFMQEQVAGDLLPADSVEQRRRQVVATAFLAMGNNNLEEQDKQQLRMDVVDEQLEAIGRAFLAQTIGCARCHDHKFDPIPTRDYYAMAGILRSTRTMEHANVSKWITAPLPADEQTEAAIERNERRVAELEGRIKAARQELAKTEKGAQPAGVVAITDVPGVVVDDAKARKVGEWKHSTSVKEYVGDGYLHDENADKGRKTITFEPELPRPGKYELRLAYTAGPSRATNVPVTVFSAEGEVTLSINQRQRPPIAGHFVSLGRFSFEKNGQGFVIVSNEGTDGHVIADAVQWVAVEELSGQPPVAASTDDKRVMPSAHDAVREEIRKMEAELKELTAKGPRRETIVSVQEEPEVGDTSVHVRGSVHTLRERVPRGFLAAVPVSEPPQIPTAQSGRRELGEWLAHPENPLPARVMANRVWHWLFGAGLVRTTDNFGTTGETPSRPELLDYLARRFTEQGWSVKGLIREIVLSRTYRLSTMATTTAGAETAAATDPENRLLWRMNRRRLEAECIRDAMLHVSGRLSLDQGGPGYPTGLTSDFGYTETDTRRSVYVPVFRNALPELLVAFDFPDASTVTGRRDSSIVAPQALFVMNNGFVLEQARHAAQRLLGEPGLDERGRIVRAYWLTLGRPPEAEEMSAIATYLRDARGDEQQKWAQVFQALFGSIDFRYVD